MWADVKRVTNAIVRSGAGGARGLDFNGKLPRTPLLMAISGTAYQVCPYSNATRGNIVIELTLV